MSGKKISLIIAGIAAIGALLAGVGAVLTNDSAPPPVAGDNVSVNGNTGNGTGGGVGCVAVGERSQCIQPAMPETPPTASADLNDDEYADSIKRDATPIPGKGPWAFTVLHDLDQGLKIRTSPYVKGQQVGLSLHRSTVWVDCVKTTDFDPDPGRAAGPHWFRVHWPTDVPGDDVATSGTGDPANGWAYAGYLTPNGSNGKVPTCA